MTTLKLRLFIKWPIKTNNKLGEAISNINNQQKITLQSITEPKINLFKNQASQWKKMGKNYKRLCRQKHEESITTKRCSTSLVIRKYKAVIIMWYLDTHQTGQKKQTILRTPQYQVL